MIQGDIYCYLGQCVIGKCGVSRVSVWGSIMVHWLSNTIEKEANANATRKQHHKPCYVVEFRLFVRFSQFYISVLAAKLNGVR